MTIFDHRHETMRPDQCAQLQLERLQALLARLRRNVRRYRELLGETRVESLADLSRLPVTEPEDLVNAFPYGMFALPVQEVIRLHSTVGPEGRPLVIGHTRNDLTQWGRLVARQLVAAGVTSNDLIQICFAGGVFGEAMGYLLGAETIEASVIPEDPYHIEYQLAMLRNYRTTVLVTTPTNAWELGKLLEARRIDPRSLHLRSVLLSRPISAAEQQAMKTTLMADVRCAFGVPEILDPGFCVECTEGRFHVNEDHFLVEIRDGELVVTTLCREAMPLLRYATRVSVELRRDKCPCGRSGAILKPGHRRDGRLRVNEMPLYEAQIAAILAQTRAAGQPFHVEILERRIIVSVEVRDDLFADTMRTLADLRQEIQSEFLTRLGIDVEVRYIGPRRSSASA
jgi:phenylacetate-CoA ligase